MARTTPRLFDAWMAFLDLEWERHDDVLLAHLRQIAYVLRAANAKNPSSVKWEDAMPTRPERVAADPAKEAADRAEADRLYAEQRVGAVLAVAPGPDGSPRPAGKGRLQVERRTRTRSEAEALSRVRGQA